MSAADPIAFAVERPPTFDRARLRATDLAAVLGCGSFSRSGCSGGLPVVAAFLVSRKGGQRCLDEDGATVASVLIWVLDSWPTSHF